MSPDINWPFWPFPRHSSRGLMSGVRLRWAGFGAGFVRIPMEKQTKDGGHPTVFVWS